MQEHRTIIVRSLVVLTALTLLHLHIEPAFARTKRLRGSKARSTRPLIPGRTSKVLDDASQQTRVRSHETISIETPSPAGLENIESLLARVTFDGAAGGAPTYHLPYESDGVFSIAIPKAYKPSLQANTAPSVRVKTRGDNLIFSFRVNPGAAAVISTIENGLEISLEESGPAEGALSPTRAATTTATGAMSLKKLAASKPVSVEPGAANESFPAGRAVATGPTIGQGPAPTAFADSSINNANIDLSVPESPAFTVLGFTPQTVVRPATARELVTTLLNGVDDRGNFQSGLALDTSPYLLFAGRLLTINRYRASRMIRLLSNTQLSFASTKGASDDDKAMRLALGLHLTVFDKGDPRLDRELDACFESAASPVGQPISPTLPAEAREAIIASRRDAFRAGVAACQEKSRSRNWNNSSWIIAAAPSWLSPTGDTGDARYSGAGVWTSLAYGFEGVPGMENTSQLILHARYRNKELVPVSEGQGQFFLEDSIFFGGRLRVGKPDFVGNFEALYLRNKPENQSYDASYRVSVGAERKIANNLWFTVSFGGNGGRADGHNKGFVLTSFKWALSPQPDTSIIK